LIVAKNDRLHLALAKQFAAREVEKIYNALVCGSPSKDAGEIHASIARHPSHRKRMAVTEGGRDARTTYRALEALTGAAFVEVFLHTGRTHQIRVHFHHIGHPLVGDEMYGAPQNKRLRQITHYVAPRQMLHARELSFSHPTTGKRLTFEAPLPPDFREGLAALRQK